MFFEKLDTYTYDGVPHSEYYAASVKPLDTQTADIVVITAISTGNAAPQYYIAIQTSIVPDDALTDESAFFSWWEDSDDVGFSSGSYDSIDELLQDNNSPQLAELISWFY